MFDDEFMNDMLLNPDLYGMEDKDEKYYMDNKEEDDDDEVVAEDEND